jgi:hypothetical protein
MIDGAHGVTRPTDASILNRDVLPRAMLAGFGAAHYQPATEEFLVVQFFHGAFRFIDGLHLYKRETF